MAGPVADSGSTEANEKVPKGKLKTKNTKWYIVGGLAVVAVLVFFFVRQSNSSAANTSGTAATTLDPSTQAALQNALQAQSGAYSSGSGTFTGAQGSAGPQGATGATGPAGPRGPAGGVVTVPGVVGMSSTAASALLLSRGLVPGSQWKTPGKVNSQTPGKGAKVPVGSTVDLGVAKSGASSAAVTATAAPALVSHAAAKTSANTRLAA
jgi:hypothetical protein